MSESALNARAKAAKKYRPEKTRILFVAESPPEPDDRYFYFEDVKQGDWLWIALMKAVFGTEFGKAKDERTRKTYWLARFQKSGFRVIDAVKEPLCGTHERRVDQIKSAAPELTKEIGRIAPDHIVLVKASVHEALFALLTQLGLPIVNRTVLPFPCSGQQKRFHTEFRQLVDSGRVHIKQN